MSDSTSNEDTPKNLESSPFTYLNTKGLPQLLQELRISLLVTTYQAQRVLLFSHNKGERLSMLMRRLNRPTGMALDGPRLAIASHDQIWVFRAFRNMRNPDGNYPYDLVFTPRHSHVTGYIDAHQLLWRNGQLFVVNTHYSCVSILEEDWSFTPVWKPPFISAITPEDRCHLNGLCCNNDGLKYVTALGETDTKNGWREKKSSGGIIIDIPSGEILAHGLSMPHSPKLYAGKLWVLESGTGSLSTVDERTGAIERVKKFKGFLRGLAFYKHFAFIGLCKAREKSSFGDLPIEQEGDLQCGVSIVNLQTMQQVEFIHFQGGVEELFDIAVMPEVDSPFLIGFEDKLISQTKIVPPEKYWKPLSDL